MTVTSNVSVEVHLGPPDLALALREDVRRGLTAEPKWLPPKWFYDERGSQLFDEITRLPEYYPTRREREILEARAGEIARAADANTLVELGSGTSTKTLLLLDALAAEGSLRRFVPFDVSEPTLATAAHAIAERYPGIVVHGVVGDFEHHLELIPRDGKRLVAFLGGTIGNLRPAERRVFLREIARGLGTGEALLLGADLVKDPERLVAAYDDAQGVTAEFNRNVLRVMNRDLGADFVPERFAHVACWNATDEWIEMRLRSTVDQTVHVPALGLEVHFDEGEDLLTEISAKFRRDGLESELRAAGLEPACWWTDECGDFALTLARRSG